MASGYYIWESDIIVPSPSFLSVCTHAWQAKSIRRCLYGGFVLHYCHACVGGPICQTRLKKGARKGRKGTRRSNCLHEYLTSYVHSSFTAVKMTLIHYCTSIAVPNSHTTCVGGARRFLFTIVWSTMVEIIIVSACHSCSF